MAEVLPLSGSELRLLAALLRHRVRFLVVGLSAAALQGAPVVTEDIDLWFQDLSDPRLALALRSVGAAYVPPFGLNPPMLGGPGSEVFDIVIRMDGLEAFNEEWRRALNVKVGKLRLKVLSLERILTSKQAANRPKDKGSCQCCKTRSSLCRAGRKKKTPHCRKRLARRPASAQGRGSAIRALSGVLGASGGLSSFCRIATVDRTALPGSAAGVEADRFAPGTDLRRSLFGVHFHHELGPA